MEPILLALSLGFAAGISPGPLTGLVISTALERGFAAGWRVAIAPLLTDAPIIALALLVLRHLDPGFLTVLTIGGGLFVLWIGASTVWKSRRVSIRELTTEAADAGAADYLRGAVTNLLSPHPWIFWVTLGVPTVIGSWRTSPPVALGFLATFFALLVGCKVVLAWLIARARSRLSDRWYRTLLSASGVLLIVMAIALVAQGVAEITG